MAGQTLHIVSRIEQPWVVENQEIGFACNLWDLIDQVVRVPPDAREVILDVPSINADSQDYFLSGITRRYREAVCDRQALAAFDLPEESGQGVSSDV
jgi:hypothetical protein